MNLKRKKKFWTKKQLNTTIETFTRGKKNIIALRRPMITSLVRKFQLSRDDRAEKRSMCYRNSRTPFEFNALKTKNKNKKQRKKNGKNSSRLSTLNISTSRCLNFVRQPISRCVLVDVIFSWFCCTNCCLFRSQCTACVCMCTFVCVCISVWLPAQALLTF